MKNTKFSINWYPKWVSSTRAMVQDQDYIKRRYLRNKVLAFQFAIEFYKQGGTALELDLAYKKYKLYINKADWYYRKIDKDSILFGR